MSDIGFRVYMLGGFRVERGGNPVPIEQGTTRPGRQLLKWLLTSRIRRLPREETFERLWPGSGGTSTPRVAINRLRQVLEPDVDARDSILDYDAEAVWIRRDADVWVDADAFEHLLSDAAHADDPMELWEQADRLYVGDYLPEDLYDDWASQRRDNLLSRWIELQFNLSPGRERRSDAPGAILALQRVLEKDPYDERAARELMLLLARHDRRSEAVRVHQRLVVSLQKELEAEPSEETEAVYRQITARAAPSAGGSAAPGGRGAGPQPGGPVVGGVPGPAARQPATPAPDEVEPPPYEPTYPFPTPELLVGRQGDMLTARRALERGRTDGQALLIGAPAGTGKSSLAGSIVEVARTMGFLCLAGGSFDQENPTAYGPIRDALADYLLDQDPRRLRAELGELTDDLEPLVPELRRHLRDAGRRPTQATDTNRLRAAVQDCLGELAVRQPVLLCLDDLHAADVATLGMLHHLALATRRRLRLTLILTYRTEEVGVNRALGNLLTAFARERLAEEIRPRPLGREDTRILLSSLLGGPVSDSLTDTLFAVTEGNPLFIEQFALALRDEQRIDQRGGTWFPSATDDAPLPPVVQSVIERRFDLLPPSGRETLTMASVMGQTFELQPLITALAASDPSGAIAVLDQAIRAQLVHETATGYRFGHAMIRESLYRGATGPGRAMLHARAGAAIEALAGERAAERAAELAYHFALAAAVAPTAAQALHYSLEAGRRAAALSAFREALDHYARAATFAEASGEASASIRLEILEGRARAERELGLWTQCIASCRSLLEQSNDLVTRAGARSTISRALRSLGDTGPALVEAEIGLAELEGADETSEVTRVRVRLLYDRSYLLGLKGQFRVAYALGKQALELGETLGTFDGVGLPLNAMISASMGLNQVDVALEHFERAVVEARRAQAQVLEAVYYENAGMALHRAGRFDQAASFLQRALELYGPTAGDVRAINAVQTLARVMLARGEVEEARRRVELALTHATEGGDRWAAECHELLGRIFLLGGAWSSAVLSFERALAVYERTGDPTDTADCLVGLGLASELQGGWQHAEQLYRRAMVIADQADQCPEQIGPRRQLGLLLARRGQREAAVPYLEQARALAEAMLPTIEYAPTLLALVEYRALATGRVDPADVDELLAEPWQAAGLVEAHAVAVCASLGAGDLRAAQHHAAAAHELSTRLGAPRLLGLAHLAAARVATASGQTAEATQNLEAAIRLLEDLGTPYDLAVTMQEYAGLLMRGQDVARGRALREAARLHFSRLGAMPSPDDV